MTTPLPGAVIQRQLAAMLAGHAGAGAGSVAPDEPIWPRFPAGSGRRTHPAVIAFVDDVHATFDVFLTEAEWEDATLCSLARRIEAKRADPAASGADRALEREQSRRGLLQMLGLTNVLVPAFGWYVATGSSARRLAVVLVILIPLDVVLLLAHRAQIRRLDAGRHRARHGARVR